MFVDGNNNLKHIIDLSTINMAQLQFKIFLCGIVITFLLLQTQYTEPTNTIQFTVVLTVIQ